MSQKENTVPLPHDGHEEQCLILLTSLLCLTPYKQVSLFLFSILQYSVCLPLFHILSVKLLIVFLYNNLKDETMCQNCIMLYVIK